MKDVNVTVKGEVLTILEGKALEQKPSEKIEISGDIKSMNNFLSIRKTSGSGTQQVDISKAVVLVDKKLLTIQLLIDPENHYGASITGKLEKSDEILPFFINQNKTFTKEELVKLIKFNKIYFDAPTKHSEILLAFQKISSTVNIKANESSDDRGNKERAYVKEVTSSAPTEFILNMPIFKGFDSIRFRVEICLDVTDGSARFWFESTELHELIQTTVDVIFNEQLKSAQGFVIINK
jgi:hypothetical protein